MPKSKTSLTTEQLRNELVLKRSDSRGQRVYAADDEGRNYDVRETGRDKDGNLILKIVPKIQ